MGARHTSFCSRALLLALASLGLPFAAHADLAANSPFLAAGAKAAADAAGPAGPIELRGIVAMPDGNAYCIYDVTKKRSTWVGMNEAGNDFVVKSADASGEGVTVDYHGSPLKLTLHQSKVSSSGAAPGPGGPAAVSSTAVFNPTPGDEQHRLDAVAQEVRRRRMEREKAAHPGQPGIPPPLTPNR